MVVVMMFICRPVEGFLQLVEDGKAVTFAIPDAEFWTWLRASGKETALEAENPARMERVRRNGVGVLTCNKQALIDAGFDTLAETESKRPPAKPVLIADAVVLEP